jgi:hypothetical protein
MSLNDCCNSLRILLASKDLTSIVPFYEYYCIASCQYFLIDVALSLRQWGLIVAFADIATLTLQ